MNYIIPIGIAKKFKDNQYETEEVFYCKVEKLHSINRHGNHDSVSPIKLATEIFDFEKQFLEASILRYANSGYSKLDSLKETLKSFKQLKKYSWYAEFRDILNKIKFRTSKGKYSTLTCPNLLDRYKAISQQMFYDLNIFFTAIIEASIEFNDFISNKSKPKTINGGDGGGLKKGNYNVHLSNIRKMIDYNDVLGDSTTNNLSDYIEQFRQITYYNDYNGNGM
jgi:hypothetical protein